MKILIYSFNDKIGDGLQKVSFLQQLRFEFPTAYIVYTTTNSTSLKNYLNPLINNCVDKFIENNQINSSLKNIFISNKYFKNEYFDLIIDLQKVVLRTISLKKISHKNFFSSSTNFYFSDIKNTQNLKFKGTYIENFYFNILSLLTNKKIPISEIIIPNYELNIDSVTTKKNKIAISPGASSNDTKWQFEKYLEIAHHLKKNDYEVFFFWPR